MLCARSCPVRHWNTAYLITVDETLIEGDRMYLNAFESQTTPDTETLSWFYSLNQARLTVRLYNRCIWPLRKIVQD